MQAPTGVRQRHGAAALLFILLPVGLQVAGAVLLKTLADAGAERSPLLLTAGLAAVVLLNLARLAVWGLAHRRFPLSTTFLLSSLFFPAMLVVAAAYGDRVDAQQVAGALLIAAGSCYLAARVRS
jgi:hypothetical protein